MPSHATDPSTQLALPASNVWPPHATIRHGKSNAGCVMAFMCLSVLCGDGSTPTRTRCRGLVRLHLAVQIANASIRPSRSALTGRARGGVNQDDALSP